MEEILRLKRPEILRIVARHGGQNPRLFGSFARGEARADSDVDLLVDMEPGRSLLDLIGLEQDLEDEIGRRVEVITEAGMSPYVRDRILSEATPL